LLQVDFDGIIIFQTDIISCLVRVNALAVKHELKGAEFFAHFVTVSLHQLAKISGTLNLEKNLIVILLKGMWVKDTAEWGKLEYLPDNLDVNVF
jgi:hypothetical protein